MLYPIELRAQVVAQKKVANIESLQLNRIQHPLPHLDTCEHAPIKGLYSKCVTAEVLSGRRFTGLGELTAGSASFLQHAGLKRRKDGFV